MTRALLVCLVLGACSKPHPLAACDALRGTLDRLGRCATLPAPAKDAIAKANLQLQDIVELLDRAGGIDKAPDDLRDSIAETCNAQARSLTETYSTLAPDCLK